MCWMLGRSFVICKEISPRDRSVATANEILKHVLNKNEMIPIRVTPEGLVSVLDFIRTVRGCNYNSALSHFHSLQMPSVEYYAFPGTRQRPTPVACVDALFCLQNLPTTDELVDIIETTFPELDISQPLVDSLWAKHRDVTAFIKAYAEIAEIQRNQITFNTKLKRKQRQRRPKKERKISAPDIAKAFERHFGERLTAPCYAQPCPCFVSAAKTWVGAPSDYKAGQAGAVSVVCPDHAKLLSIRHLHVANKNLVRCWLYRVGPASSRTVCGVCGVCQLVFWENVEACHILPSSGGGTKCVDNLVVGSPDCNRQQSNECLSTFRERIGAGSTDITSKMDKELVCWAKKEMTTLDRAKLCTDAVHRILSVRSDAQI
jgi:hypothetical protein